MEANAPNHLGFAERLAAPRRRRLQSLRRDAAVIFGAAWVLAFGAPQAQAQVRVASEYEIKAEFLSRFPKYVEWPGPAFPAANKPITIGVLGDDPFGKTLDDIVRGQIAKDRPLEVKRFRRVEDVRDCQMLFISGSESNRLRSVLRELCGLNILTVSEAEKFVTYGGMIQFVKQPDGVRFKINTNATKRAGLTVSSRLLSLAVNVRRGD